MSHSMLPETKESFSHQALAKVQRCDSQSQTNCCHSIEIFGQGVLRSMTDIIDWKNE